MKRKTKYNLIIWVVIIAYLVIVLGFVSKQHRKIMCDKLNVNILDSSEQRFVTEQDINALMLKEYGILSDIPLDSINIHELENKLISKPAIKNASVYKITNKTDSLILGELQIEIEQRKPLVKFYNDSNQVFYIDVEGVIIPAGQSFPAWVLIANGNIPFHLDSAITNENITVAADTLLMELYQIATFINDDDFWRSQFVQIYIDENNEFQLIPRVGAHRIYLGEAENFEIKFLKLHEVYFKALKYMDWNQYKSIDLRFKNQVICEHD